MRAGAWRGSPVRTQRHPGLTGGIHLDAQYLVQFDFVPGEPDAAGGHVQGPDAGPSFAGFGPVHPEICWMKLRAMADGAELATKKLWG